MRLFKKKLESYRRAWDLEDSRSRFQRFFDWLDARMDFLMLLAILTGLAYFTIEAISAIQN